MPDRAIVRSEEGQDTQLETIRDLMLAAGRRGAWLTLAEIAEMTEAGEASISAQLRHLRKKRHGRHVVDKRRRMSREGDSVEHDVRAGGEAARWEYRVLPPSIARDGEDEKNWPELGNEGGEHAEARA
jgi:hypothetical protein